MRRGSGFCLALALLLSGFQAAAQDTELLPGEPIALDLPAVDSGTVQFSTQIFFRTPEDATRFILSIEPAAEGAADNNLDLFLVADRGFDDIASVADLFERSDYLAAADTTLSESLTVERYQEVPPQGRRWTLGLLVREGAGGRVILELGIDRDGPPLAATVAVDFDNLAGDPECDTAPWNDQTPFTPVGGNQATTLGEARRNAMLEAARIATGRFRSPVPVRVAACWEASGGSATEAVLASARPALAFANFAGARAENVLYAKSVVERLAGTEFCSVFPGEACEDFDIEIRFNVDIDTDEVLGSSRWYYGLDTAARDPRDADFVGTALHELMHGLGFTTLLGDDGSLPEAGDGTPLTDPYVEQLVDNRTGEGIPLVELPSDAERLAVMQSVTGLEWRGPESATSIFNDLATVRDGFVRIYAPESFEEGSSVTHLDLVYCELMLPRGRAGCDDAFRDLGLTRPMMNELGWSSGPNAAPYLGQMFDRARNGHGFEFQLGGFDAAGRAIYVLTFYSYETLSSDPEWFQAVGFIENGVFYGDRVLGAGAGLQQYDYDAGRQPRQQPIAGHRGELVLSFNEPETSSACNDGVDRSGAELLLAMQWTIGDERDEWCVEPLVPTATRPEVDFGGLWFAGEADGGWGFSIENFGEGLFVLVYVYAADGTPVWYFGLADDGFRPGEPLTLELFQRTGFSRLVTGGSVSDASAGTLSLTLVEPSSDPAAGNRASIDVDYLGIEGGNWSRSDVAIQRLSQPR